MTHFKNRDTPHLLVLTAAWVLAIVLVNPIGNFPLNDDWAYSKDVWHLAVAGQLKLDDFPAMTRLTQIFWGAGWCQVFGFSFQVLRFSTLALGIAGISLTYLIGVELGASRRAAFFASLVLGFNPLYFSLAFTFMTDVPFLAFFLASVLFFVKSLKTGSRVFVLCGTLLALLATMIRQTGVLVPLGFAVSWLAKERIGPKSLFWAVMPLAVSFSAYLIFTKWLEATHGLPEAYGSLRQLFKRLAKPDFAAVSIRRVGILLFYGGACLAPLLVLFFRKNFTETARKWKWAAAAFTGLFALTFIPAWRSVFWGNIVYNLGTGPKTLKDAAIWLNVSPKIPAEGMLAVKVAGFLAAVFLLLVLLPAAVRGFSKSKPLAVFFWTMTVVYGGYLLLDVYFFDRYYLPLIFLLGFILVKFETWNGSRLALSLAALPLIVLAAFSIAATHDYLAWNRARWQALDYLTREKNIPPNRIDGGFEFNGWHQPGPKHPGGGKSWWWVDRDDYAVTFSDLPRFTKEKGFAYVRWLPPGVDSVFVLKHD